MAEEKNVVGLIVCRQEDINYAYCGKQCPDEPPTEFYAARVSALEAEKGALENQLGSSTDCIKEMTEMLGKTANKITVFRAQVAELTKERDALKSRLAKATEGKL